MVSKYGSVVLNSQEKILLACTADIPRRFKGCNKEATHGIGIDATEFFIDYYSNLISKKHKEIDKIVDQLKRWKYQYECELYPD